MNDASHSISLLELNGLIRQTLKQTFTSVYWVQAELSDVRTAPTGHCYLELVQKDPQSNAFLARARAIIWNRTWAGLHSYFEEITGQRFVSGIKVLAQVMVEFSELYGYSLIIQHIDPTYTLGDMARRRREILGQLEQEGVLTLNKELSFPLLLQRIAVISSATAAGYGDFCRQLEENPYELVFYPCLFPAVMQGEQTEQSILAALDRIAANEAHFDAVVIIRGGGATSDLVGFETYLLAAACAQFPLPVITGIGHERDDTVIDLVAHTRMKTPTAAAQFLITYQQANLQRLNQLQQRVIRCVASAFSDEAHHLVSLSKGLQHYATLLCVGQSHRLQLIEQRLKAVDPQLLLKRGYAITQKDGRIITGAADLQPGDKVELHMQGGIVRSLVENVVLEKTMKKE